MWELDSKESWMLKNWCFWTVVLEKTLENPLDCKEFQLVHPKGIQSWIFIGRADTEAETPILRPPDAKNLLHWKRPWCWKRLKAGGEGNNRGWDGWMTSPTLWTWVWGSSGSWWWTGRPGMLQSMGSQRVRHDRVNELNQIRSVTQSCPTLCNPMNRSTPGLPVPHQLPEFTQTHVHRVSDAIHPSHPVSSPSPPAPNPSQHQSLFQWVNSLHEVAKVLEFQL